MFANIKDHVSFRWGSESCLIFAGSNHTAGRLVLESPKLPCAHIYNFLAPHLISYYSNTSRHASRNSDRLPGSSSSGYLRFSLDLHLRVFCIAFDLSLLHFCRCAHFGNGIRGHPFASPEPSTLTKQSMKTHLHTSSPQPMNETYSSTVT